MDELSVKGSIGDTRLMIAGRSFGVGASGSEPLLSDDSLHRTSAVQLASRPRPHPSYRPTLWLTQFLTSLNPVHVRSTTRSGTITWCASLELQPGRTADPFHTAIRRRMVPLLSTLTGPSVVPGPVVSHRSLTACVQQTFSPRSYLASGL